MKAATEAALAAVEGELDGLAITEAQARVIAGYGITKFLHALPARFPLPGRGNRRCQWWGAAEGWHQHLAAEISRGQPWADPTPTAPVTIEEARDDEDTHQWIARLHLANPQPAAQQPTALDRAHAALVAAAAQFTFYADQHQAKGTPDGDQKAAVNKEWAVRMRREAEGITSA